MQKRVQKGIMIKRMHNTSIIIFFFVIGVPLAFYFFWFLRNPKIEITHDEHIVSPAHGVVTKIIPYNHQKEIVIQKKNNTITTMADDVSENGYIIIIVID